MPCASTPSSLESRYFVPARHAARPRAGLFFCAPSRRVRARMREPRTKRVVAFIDGQNLFHSVRWEFGYTFPNFDVVALARAVVATQAAKGWAPPAVRFYTG